MDNVFLFLVFIGALGLITCLAMAIIFIGRLTLEIYRVLVYKLNRSVQSNRKTRPSRRVFMVDQKRD
jgi:hypothetical protein